MSQLAKTLDETVVISPLDNSSGSKQRSFRTRKEDFTYKEVFGDLSNAEFTTEEALSYMEITEEEFLKLLQSKGYCSTGKLDKDQTFPVKFIQSIDPEKWILD